MGVSKRLVRLFVSLFVLSLFVVNVFGQGDETAAAAAVSKAEDDLASAYKAVLEAENVGGNVSGLLVRLNVAGGFLADAEMSYRGGNFSGAVYFAGLASESLAGLEGEAEALAETAAEENSRDLVVTVAASMVGVVVVVCFGFLGWGYVRERYVRKVLEMKPEVCEDVER